MRWKTDEIVELLNAALRAEVFVADPKVRVVEPGGDHDTSNVIVEWPKGGLWISGFHCTATHYDEGNAADDMEVEMVEVTDGQDSRGGLNSSDADVCRGYGAVCGALKRAGFSVCPRMKDYF